MTSNNEDMAANRTKYMAVTGSVERATLEKIKPIAPKEAIVLDEKVVLKWNAVKVSGGTLAKTYVVTIANMFDSTILVQETPDTQLVVDLSKISGVLINEKNLVWTVAVKEHSKIISDKFNLRYVEDPAKAQELHNQFTSLKAELTEETALNKLVLASFCAQNKLTLNAMEYYEEAIKMEPEVDEYKVMYGQFLSQSGLVSK